MISKIQIAGLLSAMIVSVFSHGVLAQQSKGKILRVATSADFPPFTWVEKGKQVGYDPAVINAVAERLGYSVKWYTGDFSSLFGQLDSGRVDTVAHQISVTPQREKKYIFSEPYEYSGEVLVVKKDNTSIKGFDDLTGKRVGVGFGTAHEQSLRQVAKGQDIEIKIFETDPVSEINEVVLGRVDAYFNGSVISAVTLAKTGQPARILAAPSSYQRVAFPFAKTPKGEALQKAFNEQLQALQDDGTLKKLSLQWLKVDVTHH